MISVLMSVYNEKKEWLCHAIESILNQTVRDFEFIIVVDNPCLPTELCDILKGYAESDTRIRLLYNKKNLGLAQSLNLGLKEAKGEFIARMDADDISFSERFEKELAFLTQTGADMVSCQRINIDEGGKEISRSRHNGRDPNRALPYSNYIVHPSVMMKASVVRELKGYRNFKKSQDYDLWLRMISGGYAIAVMEDYLIYYRMRESGISIRNPLEQYYISEYQKKLYRERIRKGYDSFSEEGLLHYLETKKMTERKVQNYKIARNALSEAIGMYRAHSLGCILKAAKAMVNYPEIVLKTVVTAATLNQFAPRKI